MKYKQSVYKTFALISQLGISILVPILLCTFFGTWLEKKVSFPSHLSLTQYSSRYYIYALRRIII